MTTTPTGFKKVQEGSPIYVLKFAFTRDTTTTLSMMVNSAGNTPPDNSYFTLQNADGSQWCTLYCPTFVAEGSDSFYWRCDNVVVQSFAGDALFPIADTIVWCVWTKEYYDDLANTIVTKTSGTYGSPFIATNLLVNGEEPDGVYVGTYLGAPITEGMMTKTSQDPLNYYLFLSDTGVLSSRVVDPTVMEFTIDTTSSNPSITYTRDTTYASRLAQIQRLCRHCVVKDAAVVYYLDESDLTKKLDGTAADLTGTDGDVMLEIDTIWWTVTKIDNTIKVSISHIQSEGAVTAHKYGNSIRQHVYIGVFEGINVSGKLRSISTTSTPTVSQTQPTFVSYAQANGTTYNILSYPVHTLYQILTLYLYGNRNLQLTVGNGNSSSSSAIAINNNWSATNAWTNGSQSTNIGVTAMGIQNPWGNVWKFISNFIWNNGSISFSINHNDNYTITSGWSGRPSTWRTLVTGLPTSLSGAYIMSVVADNYAVYFPSSSGGSSTTYYCDGIWSGTGERCFIVSGYWAGGAVDGLFCSSVDNALSRSYVHLGSRLQCHSNS